MTSAAQDSTQQIKTQITALQQSLKDQPINLPEVGDIGKMIGDSLKGANDALQAGQTYVSLERLVQAMDLLNGGRAMAEKAPAVNNSLPAFETEWGKASVQLASLDQQAKARNWSGRRAAIRAMAEAAQARAIPLMEGSRGFATATKPNDGLLYMGEAQGQTAYAAYLFELKLAPSGATPPFRSYLPELQRLQEKTNAAFQPPKSIDMHSRFIALNSTIKLADELDSAKSYAGALYEYLEATRHYGMLDGTLPDAAKLAQLKTALAEAQKTIAASRRDDSIAQIFVERAQSYLAHTDGSAPSPDELKSTQIIVEQVLPAYYAALKPAGPVQRAAGKTVSLTLVRWPYT